MVGQEAYDAAFGRVLLASGRLATALERADVLAKRYGDSLILFSQAVEGLTVSNTEQEAGLNEDIGVVKGASGRVSDAANRVVQRVADSAAAVRQTITDLEAKLAGSAIDLSDERAALRAEATKLDSISALLDTVSPEEPPPTPPPAG